MARIPDKHEHQRRFAELDLKDRRAIARAVNRGRAVETRAHAVFAVGVARRQQRFWRYAWLLGPLIGLVQIPFVELEAALFNLVIGTVVLGGMSAYWLWRARQAEAANLAIVERRSGGGASGQGRSGSVTAAPSGHIPGERRRPARAADDEDGDDSDEPPIGPLGRPVKPPKPRRKKRR